MVLTPMILAQIFVCWACYKIGKTFFNIFLLYNCYSKRPFIQIAYTYHTNNQQSVQKLRFYKVSIAVFYKSLKSLLQVSYVKVSYKYLTSLIQVTYIVLALYKACTSLVQVLHKSRTSLAQVSSSLVKVANKSYTSLIQVPYNSHTSLVQYAYKSRTTQPRDIRGVLDTPTYCVN